MMDKSMSKCQINQMTTVLKVGDKVSKVAFAHRLCGEVRSIFTRADGAVRLVIENIDDGGNSLLHIYSEANLALEIDHDGWIEWDGVDCPVGADTLVDYVMREIGIDYTKEESHLSWARASKLRWSHGDGAGDIIFYRIHKEPKETK